jgi:hypothetical protein
MVGINNICDFEMQLCKLVPFISDSNMLTRDEVLS